MSKPDFTEETLMAFADGELPPAQAQEVGNAANHDPSIADRIALFRASNTLLARAFTQVLDEPVPLQLYEAALGVVPSDDRAAQRLALGQARADADFRAFLGRLGVWKTVAALAFAALIGLESGRWLAVRAPGPEGAGLAAELAAMPAQLQRELDRRPSGERANIALPGVSAELVILASYRSGSTLCREFELETPSGPTAADMRAVACRSGARWLLKAAMDATGVQEAADGYRTAAGSMDLATALGLGPALSAQDERNLFDAPSPARRPAP